jgi:hypothetical protein
MLLGLSQQFCDLSVNVVIVDFRGHADGIADGAMIT